jgi:metal-responsive CopG/Arc/MetJ family transcriptional regulator
MRKVSENRERVLYTLPSVVVQNIDHYAKKVRRGNKSGFVADAIKAYIALLKKNVETNRLRDAYALSAQDSMKISGEWQVADAELDKALDDIENNK